MTAIFITLTLLLRSFIRSFIAGCVRPSMGCSRPSDGSNVSLGPN